LVLCHFFYVKSSDNSSCISDISRWVPSEGEGIQKLAQQFFKRRVESRCKNEAGRLGIEAAL
jgi:hypothetical protein